MKAVIVYSSLTGNTKKIASGIKEAIPFESDIYSIDEDFNLEKYDLIILGYWINQGMCDLKIKKVIEGIKNKSIVLFGTAGAKDDNRYYATIKNNVESMLNSSNKILGHFLCQGKLSEKVYEKYKELLEKNKHDEHILKQLENYYEAKSHPNLDDLKMANTFIRDIASRL